MLAALLVQLYFYLPVKATPIHQPAFGARQISSPQIVWITSYSTTSVETATMEIITQVASGTQVTAMKSPFLVGPGFPIISYEQSTSDQTPTAVVTSVVTDTVAEITTSLVYVPPVTVTMTQAPATITSTVVVSATPGNYWAPPVLFSDLNSFKITHFADGQQNLEIVDSIPLNATAADNDSALGLTGAEDYPTLLNGDQIVDLQNLTSLLQLFYPANSINPGSNPVGGADFYASPLPLTYAKNVTFEYAVFFPANFSWVYGGKLPGLYGGHETCSGGDIATSCFSTRLMWRPGGAGELYLYAPKDKQTYALCHTPPQSVCDEEYGLSVGRGSFYFSAGAWTDIRQTVVLNTPGKQDGGFLLEVNGKTVINRSDVFYRDVMNETYATLTASPTNSLNPDADADDGGYPSGTTTSTSDGLLAPLMSGVLGPLGAGSTDGGILSVLKDIDGNGTGYSNESDYHLPLLPNAVNGQFSANDQSPAGGTSEGSLPDASAINLPVTVTTYIWPHATGAAAKTELSHMTTGSVPFTGLFFSTFFGGSSDKYASPDDQYAWFKGFSITIND